MLTSVIRDGERPVVSSNTNASGAELAASASAATVAYWRFEDGVAGDDVIHIAGVDNTYSADILDVSGNGNHLSTWVTGGCCGYRYTDDVPAPTVPGISDGNKRSVQNTSGAPGMFTGPTGIGSISPAAFTIEVSFKPENGSFRTLIGRDSFGTAAINAELAALYLQMQPDNSLAIKFSDVSGVWHEAISPADLIQGFAFPDAHLGTWYHAAAVSDGSTLSLYVANASAGEDYQLVAQTDMTLSGSADTASPSQTQACPVETRTRSALSVGMPPSRTGSAGSVTS